MQKKDPVKIIPGKDIDFPVKNPFLFVKNFGL